MLSEIMLPCSYILLGVIVSKKKCVLAVTRPELYKLSNESLLNLLSPGSFITKRHIFFSKQIILGKCYALVKKRLSVRNVSKVVTAAQSTLHSNII